MPGKRFFPGTAFTILWPTSSGSMSDSAMMNLIEMMGECGFRIADYFSGKCIEPPEASFRFPVATGSPFRNFGAMVRIPVVCSMVS